MKIEHLAIWTRDLERMKEFYIRYFHAVAGNKYFNPKKQFTSYFLSFAEGPRIELMQMPGVAETNYQAGKPYFGLIHFAVSVGSEQEVDLITEQLRKDGFRIIGEPRRTGDGYYESVVLDPEENTIEITA